MVRMTTKPEQISATNSAGYWTVAGITVDVAVFSLGGDGRLQVLLTQRPEPPHQGAWSLPGGFLGETETLEQTAERKLQEKTGMKSPVLEQVGVYSGLARDERGRIPSVLFMALLPTAPVREGGAWPSKWAAVDELDQLAFDHNEMIDDALAQARGKLWPSLLGETFTLRQAQRAYEAITGERYDTPNFRRDILKSGLVAETGQSSRETGGPPAKLFRWVKADATAWAPKGR